MEHGKRQTETHAPRQKRRPKRGGAGRQVGFVLLTILLVGICTAGIFAAIFMKYVHTNVTPVVQVKAEDYDMSLSSFIYYQDRKTNEWVEYQTIHGEINRIPVDIEDMPDALWQAAVAIEDERFFQHDGVDWWRTGGAVVNMFFGMKNTFGGSTITQQMLKSLTEDNKPYVTARSGRSSGLWSLRRITPRRRSWSSTSTTSTWTRAATASRPLPSITSAKTPAI